MRLCALLSVILVDCKFLQSIKLSQKKQSTSSYSCVLKQRMTSIKHMAMATANAKVPSVKTTKQQQYNEYIATSAPSKQ